MTEINMTDEEFVAEYIAKATAGTIADADAFTESLFEDKIVPVDFIERLAPAITASLKEAGLIPTEVVLEAPVEASEETSVEVVADVLEEVEEPVAETTEA